MSNPLIEYINFHPVNKVGSLIGFVGFKYNREFTFSEVGVHQLKNAKGNIKVRLLYPDKVSPANKEAQQVIDEEVNAYILANYKETLT